MYGMGMKDSVKGTGVWNSFELNREEKDGEGEGEENKKKDSEKK